MSISRPVTLATVENAAVLAVLRAQQVLNSALGGNFPPHTSGHVGGRLTKNNNYTAKNNPSQTTQPESNLAFPRKRVQ